MEYWSPRYPKHDLLCVIYIVPCTWACILLTLLGGVESKEGLNVLLKHRE